MEQLMVKLRLTKPEVVLLVIAILLLLVNAYAALVDYRIDCGSAVKIKLYETNEIKCTDTIYEPVN